MQDLCAAGWIARRPVDKLLAGVLDELSGAERVPIAGQWDARRRVSNGSRLRPTVSGSDGSTLQCRVHWVRPEMVAEVSYVEWTGDGLLRHVVYLGEREDKPALDVRRDRP